MKEYTVIVFAVFVNSDNFTIVARSTPHYKKILLGPFIRGKKDASL